MCEKSGIPYKSVDVKDARQMEPTLSPETIAVFEVNDASINPFKLAIENMKDVTSRGSQYMSNCILESFEMDKGQISLAKVKNQVTHG